MQQDIKALQMKARRGISPVRLLNKDVRPLSIKSKNTMRMNSKAFPVSRRMSNAVTNTSPRAVSRMTTGRPGAARSFGKKAFKAPVVVQTKTAQKSMTGRSPLKKTVSTQPKKIGLRALGTNRRAPSYISVKKSVRRTMGYR